MPISAKEKRRYRVIDGCPAPRRYAFAWNEIKHEVGVDTLYNSIYRGTDAAGILHEYGHHTQAEVIWLSEHGAAGFGPANPVRLSSHCLYNDGAVAPHRAVGAKIPGWQCGFDVNDELIDDVERAIHRLGFHGRRVYQTGSEYHHFNLTRRPHLTARKHSGSMRVELPKEASAIWRPELVIA